MDVADGIALPVESAVLSYDDVAYEEQLPTEAERAAEAARSVSLANRIGNKVYLLSESSTTARSKRKHDAEGDDVVEMDEDEEMGDSDPAYRNNAILFNGEAIAHLPTARLFAYATHFDAHPMGLEWVDDQTCVFVFGSKKEARDAYARLTKPAPAGGATASESADLSMNLDDPTDPDFITAKPYPIALWPPEERINQTLGKGQGLKGPIRMRWAKVDDVKRRGAKNASQFYKKHGTSAGKELFNGRELPPTLAPAPVRDKRKRDEMTAEDEERRRRELDRELDEFLAEDEDEDERREAGGRRSKRAKRRSVSRSPSQTPSSSGGRPRSPPSKMRSDYIGNDGRSLLERTSVLRHHPLMSDPLDKTPDLASRLMAPLPRRAAGRRRGGRGGVDVDGEKPAFGDRRQDRDRLDWRRSEDGGSDIGRRRGGRKERERRERGERGRPAGGERTTGERPRKTQQELDDELDAFLNGKD